MASTLDIITPHPTWDILDASKLKRYKECPRKFFYTYILGWTSATPNNHLVFGSAWHVALEHLYLNRFSQKSVLEAHVLFLEHYRAVFPAETDELFQPKTPENGTDSLTAYAETYRRDLEDFRVLYTELGGVMLVSPERTMTFKHDVILMHESTGDVVARDYKTAQRHYTNWGEHWELSTQMQTYLHALHCLYPDQAEMSIIVDCAFFYATDKKRPPRATEFATHMIAKTHDQMQAWLDDTNEWIDRMDYDKYALIHHDDTDQPTMRSYPKNDNACFNYGRRCQFFDFCTAWANPLTRCDEPPIGFNVEWWDPLAQPEIRQTVDLTKEVV